MCEMGLRLSGSDAPRRRIQDFGRNHDAERRATKFANPITKYHSDAIAFHSFNIANTQESCPCLRWFFEECHFVKSF